MNECKNCGFENTAGALVCERCGVALVGSVSTRDLRVPPEVQEVVPADKTIRLHVKGSKEPIVVNPDDKPVVLGRQGGADSASTFVDLERFGALDLGVSRRHAVLQWTDDQLVLTDLGSVNYTYLNGRRLRANRNYEVRDGDHISLGKLSMNIFF